MGNYEECTKKSVQVTTRLTASIKVHRHKRTLWVQGHFYFHAIKLCFQNEIFHCWRWERLRRTWPPGQTWFKELLDWEVVQVWICVCFRTRNGRGEKLRGFFSLLCPWMYCRVWNIKAFGWCVVRLCCARWLGLSQLYQIGKWCLLIPRTPLEPIRWIWIRWRSCKQTPGKEPLSFMRVARSEPLSPAQHVCVWLHATSCCSPCSLSWPCQDVFFSFLNCWRCEYWEESGFKVLEQGRERLIFHVEQALLASAYVMHSCNEQNKGWWRVLWMAPSSAGSSMFPWRTWPSALVTPALFSSIMRFLCGLHWSIFVSEKNRSCDSYRNLLKLAVA